MKYFILSITVVLSLISSSAVAQDNSEDSKIMSRLTAGDYTGPYHKGDELRPLIVIQNGQDFYKVESSDLIEINPDWIEQAEVIKGESAVRIFGERGGNGVVMIILKEDDKAARKYFKTIKKNKIKV